MKVREASRSGGSHFIDVEDSACASRYQTAMAKRCSMGLGQWHHATHGWNQRGMGCHRGVTPIFPYTLREK